MDPTRASLRTMLPMLDAIAALQHVVNAAAAQAAASRIETGPARERVRLYCDGEEFICASGYVARCISAIAGENLPDARWAMRVLNAYGHLVAHEADGLGRGR